MKKFCRLAVAASLSTLPMLSGCMGGGNNAGSGYGAYGGGNNSAYGLGSVAGDAMGGGLTGAVLNAIIQSMAGSVLNGQIGSQLAPADQNFRLQQLGSVMHSGALNQPQHWTNPQTGNSIALQPLGPQSVDPNTHQNCRNLEEVVTLKKGKKMREKRRACQNAQTGQWNLVQ